jgi:hypothetical protein
MGRILFINYLYLLIVVVLILGKELEGCLDKEKLGLLYLKPFLISNSGCTYNNLMIRVMLIVVYGSNHTTGHVIDLLLGKVTIPTNTTDVWLLN